MQDRRMLSEILSKNSCYINKRSLLSHSVIILLKYGIELFCQIFLSVSFILTHCVTLRTKNKQNQLDAYHKQC